ncbi:hypothetical protein, partial [Acetobacter sp. DsW_063]|uniref:hypothetical protein n=1 Tax=Acetobacter sp. DsW_063 TaxID=1514894 RepID=UPI000A371023
MSGTISFNEIPSGWKVPGAYAEVANGTSNNSVTGVPLRALIIGVLGSGAGVAGAVYRNVTPSLASVLAGPETVAARAVKAFNTDAPYTALDLVLVASASGSASAVWTVTPVLSTSAVAGQVALQVNGVRIATAVTAGMTAAALGAAIAASFTAALQTQTGVTCAVSATTGALTLTATEKGGWTSDIDVRQSTLSEDTTAGVSFTIAATTPGAGWPDMSPAITATSHTWYTDIASCLYDQANLTTFATELSRRFNAMVKLDAQGYVSTRMTYSQALALGDTLNSRFLTVLPANGALFEPAVAAASYAAVASAALNTDPSRQLRGLELTALAGLGPDDADRFDMDMRQQLLSTGMSTFLVGQDGTVTIERAITTNQT